MTKSLLNSWRNVTTVDRLAKAATIRFLAYRHFTIAADPFVVSKMYTASLYPGSSLRADLEGWRGYAAAGLCCLPVIVGFVAPFIVLLAQASAHVSDAFASGFWRATRNSIGTAAVAAVVTVALGLGLAYARRLAPNAFVRAVVRAAGLGYAMPGTVLALGLLIPLAAFDNRIDAALRSFFGISTGLLLSGSLFAIVLAYTIRFVAVSLGALEAGFERLSPNLDAAARTLGETALSALRRVHMPLLLPALGAAALLVFVDGMKELPATLLLRPFNFETLATHVYSYAALEQFEQAALGALTIVVIGLVPVLLLHNAVAGGRAGTWSPSGRLVRWRALIRSFAPRR